MLDPDSMPLGCEGTIGGLAHIECPRSVAMSSHGAPLARIGSVGHALPDHYYDQETLLIALKKVWQGRFRKTRRLEQLHRAVLVGGRHLALPIEAYEDIHSMTDGNNAFVRCAVDLGERAILDGLDGTGLRPRDIDHLFFVSVTGIATPSIDARLVNRLGLRTDIKRTPVFGLGCVAGAAGIARAADYLRAYPDQIAVLLSVELCSLTLQRSDLSIANFIASGLFGDGAAAVVMAGSRCDTEGPRVIDTRSVFYPNTEDVMGWDITTEGFRIVLSGDIPKVVRKYIRRDVDGFLAGHDLTLGDMGSFVCHSGGPKVLEAFEEALELPGDALTVSWDSLKQVGNLSSASVLMVLRDTMAHCRPTPGSYGLLLAMGPGFCSELVLLKW